MDKPHPLWHPGDSLKADCNLTHYIEWLRSTRNLNLEDYHDLWTWSVGDIEGFWSSIWEYFEINFDGQVSKVLAGQMPRVQWFGGTFVSYSEHIFRHENGLRPALRFRNEAGIEVDYSWKKLRTEVASLRKHLVEIGVQKGDRVVGWLPNVPEAVVSFLAANSIGAIWSSTSPDFGITSVIDRFSQVEPKVLITANGYCYNGRNFDKSNEIQRLIHNLPTLTQTVLIDYIETESYPGPLTSWNQIMDTDGGQLAFERVPFDHPIWVLYSSGTTGLPKAITHGTGGILLEHLKYQSFHNDVRPGENFFWFTTTGWMMWNYLVASMLCGATVILYDGSPGYPDLNTLWKLSEDFQVHHFGTSAPFIVANLKKGITPSKDHDLSNLRSIGSTGAPLPPEGFDWVYDKVKADVWLTSMSGGTDVCSAFVGGNPLWSVYSGEIQCRALGCSLFAYDENGNVLEDEVGEMVITKPMPSMPVFFWNDIDFVKYTESYFQMYPGIWRHGDWIRITSRKGLVIYGRSDATLNRGGVRIGTSEIYRVLDKMPAITDSIIVCVDKEHGEFYMPLFIVLKDDLHLEEGMVKEIKAVIRSECSPRHVPDDVFQIYEVPYTISGKKTEAPVKKILMGKDVSDSLNRDALKNPRALDYFIQFARKQSY